MKKVMYLMGFSVLCLFGLESFGGMDEKINPFLLLQGELPILTTSDAGDGGPSTTILNCTFEKTYPMNAANIEIGVGGPENPPLPAGPLFYVRVTITDLDGNESSDIFPVLDWTFDDYYGIYNEPVYEGFYDVILPVKTLCYSESTESLWDMHHELLMYLEDTGIYVPYPVCDQNDPGQYFSCEVFESVPCDDEIDGECNSLDYNSFDGSIYVNCGNCGGSGFAGGNNSNEKIENSASFQITASTNPFSEQLKINWTGSQAYNSKIVIYNSVGQAVIQRSLKSEEGSTTLNTSTLSKGVYILVANNGESKETIKLVKQ